MGQVPAAVPVVVCPGRSAARAERRPADGGGPGLGGTVLASPRPLVFFSSRRRHTRCLSDRSSDVCSSDLVRQKSQKAWIPVRGGRRGWNWRPQGLARSFLSVGGGSAVGRYGRRLSSRPGISGGFCRRRYGGLAGLRGRILAGALGLEDRGMEETVAAIGALGQSLCVVLECVRGRLRAL